MIVFFGPAGAGKSMQGQILAARHGWRWISAGNLLRESKDQEIRETIARGDLVNPEQIGALMIKAINDAERNGVDVILDGWPRSLEQAKMLTEYERNGGAKLTAAVLITVPKEEIMARMKIRGRSDDMNPAALQKRLEIFANNMQPLLDYYDSEGVKVVKINGVGTVGKIHDEIEEALES